MPNTYTKEQIDEAKEWFSSFTKQKHHGLHEKYGAILLSALDTAERERDENERKGKDLCTWVGNLMMEREQATETATDLAEKVAKAEGRAKLLEARVAELAKAGNSAIVELRKNESEYSYERYLRAVKNLDALIADFGKRVPRAMLEFPRQPNKEGGWTIEYSCTEKIWEALIETDEYCRGLSMEEVESVLLFAEKFIKDQVDKFGYRAE